MIYEEKTKFNRFFAASAAILLLMLYAPFCLNFQELFSDEGFYISAARELQTFPPLMTAQGDVYFGGYPLYPFLVSLISRAGIPMEYALRLIPCVSFLVLAVVVFLSTWKAKSVLEGIIAASVLMLNLISIDKFSDGNPVLLATLGIFSAWMIWFTLGVWQGYWNLTWIISFLLLGIVFYTIGISGVILTVFPMFFHRRPLTVWTKPRDGGFITGLMVLLFFLLLWGIPRWTAPGNVMWRGNEYYLPTIGEYLIHLATFPFDAAFRFLPWTLFAWAPFCPAIVPLDENPLLSRYLRTLFLGTFVLLWLSPFTESRDMFYMVPPLAVLVALNYWIVVRRYGWKLLRVFQILAVTVLILCTGLFSYLLIPQEILPEILFSDLQFLKDSPYWKLSLICSAAGAVFALSAILMCSLGSRVWLVICILSAAVIIPYRGVILPCRGLESPRKKIGQEFRNALPGKELPKVVYRMYDVPPSYCEMYYFGIQIKTISAAEELPENDSLVYVFSSVVPSAPERNWECLHKVFYKNRNIELWCGELKTEEDYE